MQLIAEGYDILKRGLGLHESEIGDIFAKWNKGVLDSFLIDITTNILKFNDDDGTPLLTKILDSAGQKGTGKWTAIAALDAGTPGKAILTNYPINHLKHGFHSYFDRRGCVCTLLVFFER